MMKRRQIGKTDVFVTDLAFGASGIGNMGRVVSDEEAGAVLERAWQAGIRYFDTAPHYGRGLSEQRLGRFLKQKNREDIVLSTKVGRVLSPGPALAEADGFVDPLPKTVRYDYSGDGLEASLEHSLELLDADYIDIVYVHDIGAYTHGEGNDSHLAQLLETGIDRLLALKQHGKIGAFGLGVNESRICLEVLKHVELDVILLAGRLTLLDREAEDELVGVCRTKGTSLVLGGIFNSGILATGPVEGAWYDYQPATKEILERVRILQRQFDALDVPLPTAALHFAHRHPDVASVLLGTAKVSSLERNLAAFAQELPDGCLRLFEQKIVETA